MINFRIKDLNENEKPREKMVNQRPEVLTNEELLALIIGSGGKGLTAVELARELLKKAGNLEALAKYEISQYKEQKYINTAKATALKASFELSKRVTNKDYSKLSLVNRPEDVYKYLKIDIAGLDKEYLFLLSVDSRNRILAKDIVSIGTINETIVSPREIFATALKRNASCIIIAHNHPSNDTSPSKEDIKVTEKIAKLGKEMNLPLLDHLVVSESGFISMKQLNLFNTYERG